MGGAPVTGWFSKVHCVMMSAEAVPATVIQAEVANASACSFMVLSLLLLSEHYAGRGNTLPW
jgi:hypothetical protein